MGQFLRLVIILVGLWLILTLVKRALASRRKPRPDNPPIAKMVACDLCGTHVPEGEAIHDGDKHFCSKAHQERSQI